ncbi:MAG: tetratricopeptide repeat protein [Acidobacteriota bacterium]
MELRQLQAALDDVRADAGAARGILLSGESGVGKTRLLGELARIARIREMTVVTAGCAPGTRAPLAAFRPMLRALADRCREHGSAAAALAKEAPVLAPYEPDLARLAGTAQPAPADLPPAEAAARLFRALTAALSTLAGDSSVLVIVDDLQWADDLSIGFCEHLVTGDSPGAARVLLVCGYRREEITDPVARLAERNVTRMTLERIDLEGVASMVRDALALQRTPDAFARFLTQHSEGNPFFVAEYLKTAVSEGLLTRDARGTWRIADAAAALVDDDASRLPLPPPVRDLVTRRLAMVGDRSRALLELAAATGRESNRTFLAAAMVLSGASMSIDALSVACERGLIEEAPDGAIRFTHDKIREVVLADAPRDRMRGLHATIARTGETLYRDRDDWVAELARQWDEAGEPAKAAPCYQRAATIAAARHALADAERLLRACLRVTEEKSAAGIVARFDLASRVLDQAGRMSEAEEVILTAVGGARAIGNRRLEADGLRQHAVVCYRTGRMEEARERAIQSLAICRELADRRREGQALGLLGSIALDVGGATEAWERYETALAIHREVGDEPSAGSVLSSMALMAQRWGHAERATGLYEEALASAQKTGARWSEGISRGNLALLHQAAGRMADARDELERALAIHREVGNRRFEGATLGNLGKLHLDQGRLADAARLLDEATHIHEQVNNRTHGAVTLANVALLFRAQGRLEESRDACARAVAIFGELGDVQRKGNRLADLGKVLQELGQLVEARAAYTESLEIARRVDNRQREGIVLRDLAGLERLADADPATIAKLLDDAEAILVSAGEDAELLELACERGHAAIASGRSATSHLAEAEKRIAALGAGPESLRGIAVARLHRAQSAHDAALLLRHGMALQDLPSGS